MSSLSTPSKPREAKLFRNNRSQLRRHRHSQWLQLLCLTASRSRPSLRMETRKIKRTEFLQRMGMKYGGLGIAAFLYVGFTEWTGLSLACPFRWLTGLQCPGCGATRMVTALLHRVNPERRSF